MYPDLRIHKSSLPQVFYRTPSAKKVFFIEHLPVTASAFEIIVKANGRLGVHQKSNSISLTDQLAILWQM